MRKELADRGLRVSAAWSRAQLEAALARIASRAERHAGDLGRAASARSGRAAKTAHRLDAVGHLGCPSGYNAAMPLSGL